MNLSFEADPHLPPLAWCAVVLRDNPSVRVRHGKWVETNPSFFFEGAWDGDFALGAFHDSTACCGSGAVANATSILFSTPSHILERLYFLRSSNALYISNSLAFVLAEAGDNLDPSYRYYSPDLMLSLRGYEFDIPSLRTAGGNQIDVRQYCNISISASLQVSVLPKRSPPAFASYAAYRSFLSATLAGLAQNGADLRRVRQYTLLATISAGYDSPACAALAQELGCTEAATFARARSGYETDEDSGAAIADILGITVREFDRTGYLSIPDYPEAEFLASGMGGEDVIFAALGNDLAGRIFLTGYLGDTVWGLNSCNVNTRLRMIYPAGSTLGEFRLRTGFVHVPLPVIGYIQHPSISAISRSNEMKQWTLGTSYDRPIPRRILEERGVKRDMFGNHKMAITQPLWNTNELDGVLGPQSWADLKNFVKEAGLFRSSGEKMFFSMARTAYQLNERVAWRLGALWKKLGKCEKRWMLVPQRFAQDRGPATMAMHWGVAHTMRRYRKQWP